MASRSGLRSPPALEAVTDGRMVATVRNPSCLIHGGAIIAGCGRDHVRRKDWNGTRNDPEARRDGRTGSDQGQRARPGIVLRLPQLAGRGGANPLLELWRAEHCQL